MTPQLNGIQQGTLWSSEEAILQKNKSPNQFQRIASSVSQDEMPTGLVITSEVISIND